VNVTPRSSRVEQPVREPEKGLTDREAEILRLLLGDRAVADRAEMSLSSSRSTITSATSTGSSTSPVVPRRLCGAEGRVSSAMS
jgi:hypothetical protein